MRAQADLLELIQRRTPACEAVADLLPALADDGRARGKAKAHVEHCLRCQAEVAGYRRLLRMMRTLRTDARSPEPDTLIDLLAALDAESGHRRDGGPVAPRALLVGGVVTAAAAAAGAAGVLAWVSRHRQAG
jgi:hypothetical protein